MGWQSIRAELRSLSLGNTAAQFWYAAQGKCACMSGYEGIACDKCAKTNVPATGDIYRKGNCYSCAPMHIDVFNGGGHVWPPVQRTECQTSELPMHTC